MAYEQFIRDLNYLGKKDLDRIKKAYEFAQSAHQGQFRQTGEPFFSHSVAVAKTLALWKLDADTIIAALLHDVLEDTTVKIDQIRHGFGKNVANLVEAVTKLGRIRIKKSWFPFKPSKKENLADFERQAETLRKMIIAMSRDIRAILIKLADRLHNMKTLHGVEQQKQARIAKETLEIYAPIAHRLGMNELRGVLEDLAFPYVYPAEYKWITELAVPVYKKRQKYLSKIIKIASKKMRQEKIKFEIHGRAKHIYSLYRKMLRHDKDLSQIYDLVAVRIIVLTIEDCYKVLGILHANWKPLVGKIKDYIALPKPNGYQSLHTTVFCQAGEIVEFQIRTVQMHELAENGIAAHWHYSQVKTSAKMPKETLIWIQKLARWQKSLHNPKSLYEDLKLDFFKDRIFVFTPKGDIKDLPAGATSVDFAYAIHTQIGNRCVGAKCNGKMIGLSKPLENADIVEILIARKGGKPKRDWLNFVKTSLAKNHIRKFFKLGPVS
ncbi:MAG: hypothetical protein COX39_00375 [Candidatus Nealsonbacteria bacterium CG23_combo_of_CG06-09_8_20_14_all_40_13]|uniref:(P)ppGpp synthetase n=1 Tax=Candidatus Nealsonbacteria bacterium CG23_combo_of_CG06-09_8_20_14_all_40_13 TaxID=1974724 RepID=A0A2G9YT34_9BACT|nr:MAG: hypothetical protein COX39_00375 [Candidatus Nealsonbacteria bacterium CG23_combo_of_CG06-09_8_20_14_all_40_13]PIR70781.1 MAG: hypothetical protein COU44_03180 [Candidatus Nealsonbacteria bacterium CG10_big_fil_rev_8_21_14_0_10_40_24]PIU43405.1 MAG: hypothetical protein COS97_01190 [Candidatus Nealsonbacteria bacterium CG07_land_8_20_14_0_80_40_10]